MYIHDYKLQDVETFYVSYWVSDARAVFFFCQAEDGIRDLVRSRGLGDVYKRQPQGRQPHAHDPPHHRRQHLQGNDAGNEQALLP